MIKSEFEKLVRVGISADDYKVIECVYMYHPAIDNVYGKQMIASLFLEHGFDAIKSMMPIAKLHEALKMEREES